MQPNTDLISYVTLKRAIMKEIGTDKRTVWSNKKALSELGWIKKYSKTKCKLTGKDIE